MKVNVVSRSGKEIVKDGVHLSDSATVADLQEAINQPQGIVNSVNNIVCVETKTDLIEAQIDTHEKTNSEGAQKPSSKHKTYFPRPWTISTAKLALIEIFRLKLFNFLKIN